MRIIQEKFELIKKSMDPEVINNFLLELATNPEIIILKFLDFFLENSTIGILEKIKINIIYLLGKLGKTNILDVKYQELLIGEYFKSDRWVRLEILQAFESITKKNKLTDNIIQILKYSLFDDYFPIKVSSLSLLYKFDHLPEKIVKKLFHVQSFSDSNIIDAYSRVLKKFYQDEWHLFQILTFDEIYKDLNKNSIRTLLLIFFRSILELENLRNIISKSEWHFQYKEIYLKEIDTYEKILIAHVS